MFLLLCVSGFMEDNWILTAAPAFYLLQYVVWGKDVKDFSFLQIGGALLDHCRPFPWPLPKSKLEVISTVSFDVQY